MIIWLSCQSVNWYNTAMKYLISAGLLVIGLVILLLSLVNSVKAQVGPVPAVEIGETVAIASEAAMATQSAEATGSAGVVRRITEKSTDLTETGGQARGKLEQFVLENLDQPLTYTNVLRFGIKNAVDEGVPANTIVLVLLFPLVTALIAASRHLVGLRGFGIFTPAVVAVGFLATGLTAGFILFFTIIAVATASRVIIRRLRLPYLPRTSVLLWVVSVTVLLILLIAPYINLHDLTKLSIFPILLMVLLAETFIEVQVKRSRSEAIEMTLETLLLAVASYFVMNLQVVQLFVIANPELVLISILIFNVFIGKFDGLRLMEYWRFRNIMD